MPNPTPSDLHVSAALSNMSVLYDNEDTASVHDKVFPVIPVLKQGDKYFVYDRQDWLRADARLRGPGAEAAVGGYRVSQGSYYAERIALKIPVSDPERANADPAVANLDFDATRYVTAQVRLKREQDWVADHFTTGVWDGASSSTDMTGQAAPTSTTSNFRQWNDIASTPIEDLRGEMYSGVQKVTARLPNTLILGPQVYTALADHPDIIDRIKYTERGVVTTDLLASLLGLDRVLIASMVKDSANEGTSASYAYVAGKSALLCYVSPTPGLRQPSAGYTFVWTGMPGAPASGQGVRIKRYRDESKESDMIEGENWADFKTVGSSLAAFFASAVA